MYNHNEGSWEATELMRRYPFVTSAPVCGVMLTAILVFISLNSIALAADDQSILQTDREFVQAAAKRDTPALAKVLDALPTPALGNETGAQLKQQTHSQVGAVMSSRDKTHVLRLWVHRPAGWRLLVYHEVVLGRQVLAPAGPGVSDCENPCRTLPFKPRNESEQAIIASWQALETGVTKHDAAAWAPHIADEFVMRGSTNDHRRTKADRIATLN